ncbi:Hypothetical protein R9X50_00229100 [Acrodontium crateriforme]|uniref:Ribokinase n=1 Tax=Acrodontium crateriforme TaxID=150365 RepID=A0AAQ3M6P1_9PEZI|nr:Hypothetical protein R9X50_00229100 [Acrodontium crateriforme]
MTTPRICVVGSLNIDFVTYTPRCPGAGETLTASSFAINAGGKGANQAVACGRASFTAERQQDVLVDMIGAVGKYDAQYTSLLQPTLENSGVSTKLVRELENDQTGSATIIVEDKAGGENRILVVPGANHSGMSDIESLVTSIESQNPPPSVIVMQGEIPRATVLGLLKHFNRVESTAHICFNPAPVFPDGIPLDALSKTAVLVMNETEAGQLMSSFSDVSTIELENLQAAARQFHDVAKIGVIIITLGSKGVFYSTMSGKNGHVPGVRVPKVIDTTAAGDTFVGYLAAALARHTGTGANLEEFDAKIESVVRVANEAAAKTVQRKGAMQSIPFAYE